MLRDDSRADHRGTADSEPHRGRKEKVEGKTMAHGEMPRVRHALRVARPHPGIPTRIVLGQRRFAGEQGDTWGGHMVLPAAHGSSISSLRPSGTSISFVTFWPVAVVYSMRAGPAGTAPERKVSSSSRTSPERKTRPG